MKTSAVAAIAATAPGEAMAGNANKKDQQIPNP
jgi:hypothetical protein